MNDNKIKWCILQSKGIQLIEISPHLSSSYMKEADETLENVFSAKGKWKVIMAYYACYNAFYSILMACGVKSEIHDCTIELLDLFDFNNKEIKFLKELKEDRIKAQYYLKEIVLKNQLSVKQFILKCKEILRGLNSENIEEIRKLIKNLKK